MHALIDDPVDVIVSFDQNRVIPKRMRWDNRIYNLKAVNLIHTAREGAKRVFYFSVSDLTNSFKLRLDTESLEWRLVETYSAG